MKEIDSNTVVIPDSQPTTEAALTGPGTADNSAANKAAEDAKAARFAELIGLCQNIIVTPAGRNGFNLASGHLTLNARVRGSYTSLRHGKTIIAQIAAATAEVTAAVVVGYMLHVAPTTPAAIELSPVP